MPRTCNSKYKIIMISVAFILTLSLSFEVVGLKENNNASMKSHSMNVNLSKEQAANQYDVTGLWKMVEDVAFQYALELQQSENIITGNITNTIGQKPIGTISGFVYPDGKIVFNRTRPGVSPQVYTGIISGSGDSLIMQGNYTSVGVFQYPWNATRTKRAVSLSGYDSQAAIDAVAPGGSNADANSLVSGNLNRDNIVAAPEGSNVDTNPNPESSSGGGSGYESGHAIHALGTRKMGKGSTK